jgi:hypothetical protein
VVEQVEQCSEMPRGLGVLDRDHSEALAILMIASLLAITGPR